MRLQSDVAQLQRELQQLQHSLKAERSLQQSLEQQLREVSRARTANSQSGQWQLGAVKQYHNMIVQSAPVRVSEQQPVQDGPEHKFSIRLRIETRFVL